MIYAVVLIVAVLAAAEQAVTGFGAAIFMMLFFSYFMPVTTAAALTGVMCLASNVSNIILHWKHIQWKHLILPVASYFVISFLAIRLSMRIDTGWMKKIFGAVLILLSVYFLFVSKKIRVRPTAAASIICGSIAGVTGGLFGASAPPVVVYLAAATDTKERYLGTVQGFCLLTGLWSFGVRLFSGFYIVELIPLILIGVAGVLAGQFIGTKVVHKISADVLRIAIYVMLAVSGVINLFT